MIEAWLDAVVETLAGRLDLVIEKEVGLQPEGHPPAASGQRYYAVDELSIQSAEKTSLSEIYTIGVWLSYRCAVAPADRRSNVYRSHLRSLSGMERDVIRVLHGNQAVRILACAKLGIELAALEGDETAPGGDGSFGDAFQWPLWYTGRGKTDFMTGDWAGLEPDKAMFMVRRLQFTGGLRVQSLAIQR